jgi:hypothetical protein
MRSAFAISLVIHTAILLWITLAPGAKPFDPARAEPILVDLLSPQEMPSPAEPQPSKTEPAKSELPSKLPDFDLPKPAPVRSAPDEPAPEPVEPAPVESAPVRPELPKSVLQADPKPQPKSGPETSAQADAADQGAAAALVAWMLNLPVASSVDLGALPSESPSNLSSDEIAKFKVRVSKCWVAPADVPNTPGFSVLIRIALNPDGALGAEPRLVLAPASLSGPPLVASAMRALQQCQPYDFLPADKYQDWKVLELSFSANGPSDDLRPSARNDPSPR